MINIIYIRAAIEAATGVRVSLERTRELLLEEGLITPKQYRNDCFMGVDYSSLYEFDSADVSQQSLDLVEGIPL
jgi:hypothetical protein